MRQRGVIAGMITNGYLLTADRIKRLNDAGLDHMQISIDNVMPDDVSKKSLKVLDKKLQLLAEHSNFHVNINSVLGGGIHNPHDALTVSKRALELGFTSTVGIIHDHEGQLRPLGETRTQHLPIDQEAGKGELLPVQLVPGIDRLGTAQRLAAAAPARATCISARTAWCITARSSAGYPAKPLAEYTVDDIRREYITEKGCAPYCTVSCVHQVSYLDFWRAPQTIKGPQPVIESRNQLVQFR